MKKGIIIGLVVIGFVVVALILLMGTSQYEVEYFPVLGEGYDAYNEYLKIIIRCPPENLYVTVINPKGTVIDEEYISEEKLLDGRETVMIRMSEFGTVPKPGTYTIIIKEALSNKIVYKAKPTFKGVKLKITDVEYKWIKRKYDNLAVALKVKNEGDLPICYNAIVRINGKHDELYNVPSFVPLCIRPGEKRRLANALYIPLEEGVNTAVIELYGDKKACPDTLLTRFTSEFTYEVLY